MASSHTKKCYDKWHRVLNNGTHDRLKKTLKHGQSECTIFFRQTGPSPSLGSTTVLLLINEGGWNQPHKEKAINTLYLWPAKWQKRNCTNDHQLNSKLNNKHVRKVCR